MNSPVEKKVMESMLKEEGFIIATPEFALQESSQIVKKAKQLPKSEAPKFKESEKNDTAEKKISDTPKIEKTEDQKLEDAEHFEDDIKTIVNYINWHIERINNHVIGRKDIIEQAFYAILTGEHLLLLSRTGMAKSYLSNYIFESFDNVRLFSSQASKDQTPDNYFGPYNIEEFKKGRIRHNLHGSIIEADLVFLDEFFDASDVVLRSLLSVLNERKFINGQEQVDTAIHSAIATANYMRMNEVTEAVLDRFLYKSIIPEEKSSFNKFLIDQSYISDGGYTREAKRKTPFEKIKYLHNIIKNKNKDITIPIPDHISYLKNIIIDKYVGEMRKHEYEYYISPRRQAKTIDFLRASALLEGRKEVNEKDLEKMYLPLCTLNSFVSVRSHDKQEKDLFTDCYRETMSHMQHTGGIEQIKALLQIRSIFKNIQLNPEKKEEILSSSSLLTNLFKMLQNVFKKDKDDDILDLKKLFQTVSDIKPSIEEVAELREGILTGYRHMI